MSSSRTPNNSRFNEVAVIYRDEMVRFIEPVLEEVHGPEWILSQVLNDTARERTRRKYEEGMHSLKQGTPPGNLIDHADIPRLIKSNLCHFPGLNDKDLERMYSIRGLWNDKIKHPHGLGDIPPEDAAELAVHCIRVLRSCGCDEAVNYLCGLISPAPANSPSAPKADASAKRRAWDKQRLARKSAEELTESDQDLLVEIAWAEKQERDKLLEREHAEIARIGQNIDDLRSWFNGDPGREQRHSAKFANLQRDEQEREHLAEERAAQERLAKEQDELAQLGPDIDARQTWFDADPGREERHPSEFAELQREQKHLAKERDELAQLGSDLKARQGWFNADPGRQQRHSSEFAELQREQERLAIERDELAQLGSDIDARRNWFDTDPDREQRHPSEFADLQRAEQERTLLAKEQAERECLEEERGELAQLGSDIDIRQSWFDTDPGREQRHPSEFAELQCAEQERLEDEREELTQLGSNIAARRSWFNADPGREQRHPSAFAELQRVPGRLAKEQAELAQLGSDIALRRSWFAADVRRRRRHQPEFMQLERDELDQLGSDVEGRRSWFAADVGRKQQYLPEFIKLERDELDQIGLGIEERRSWFKADPGRKQRHPSEFATLEQD